MRNFHKKIQIGFKFRVCFKESNDTIKLFFIIHFFYYCNELKLNIEELTKKLTKKLKSLHWSQISLHQSESISISSFVSWRLKIFVNIAFLFIHFGSGVFCDFPSFCLQVYITLCLNKTSNIFECLNDESSYNYSQVNNTF